MSREPFQRDRVVEELRVLLLRAVQRPHVLDLLDGLCHGVALARLVRDHLRDPVRLAHLEAQHPAHVPDHGAALHRAEGDDLAHRVATVLAPHVLDHLAPALVAEVDVDVGHRDPLGVQEALEEKAVRQRVQVRDPQRVGDQRARRRASSRPHRDPVFARPADEVPSDQEVARVARLEDHVELVAEPLAHFLGQRLVGRGVAALGVARSRVAGVARSRALGVARSRALGVARSRAPGVARSRAAGVARSCAAVARLCALLRQVHQVVVVVVEALRQWKAGQVVLLSQRERDFVGDLEGVLDYVGAVRKRRCHLRRVLEVEAVVVGQAVGFVLVLRRADADEDVVGAVVLVLEEVSVVGGDHGQAQLFRQRKDLRVELGLAFGAVRLHFQVVPVLEDVGVPLGHFAGGVGVASGQVAGDLPGHARRRDDQPLRVARQGLPVDSRVVVEALGVPDRRQLDQVAVALRVAGQQDQVIRRLAPFAGAAPLPPVSRRHVRLHADDRRDALLAGQLLEAPGAVHAAVVGEPQGRHLELLRFADQVREAVGPVQQRVLGVRVEVDEGHRARPSTAAASRCSRTPRRSGGSAPRPRRPRKSGSGRRPRRSSRPGRPACRSTAGPPGPPRRRPSPWRR